MLNWLRRFLVFALGVALIVDTTLTDGFHVLEFTVGIIMVGIIPIDYIVDALTKPARDEAEMEHLKEVLKTPPPPPNYKNDKS